MVASLALALGYLACLLAARLGMWTLPWPLSVLDTFAFYAFLPFLSVALAAFHLRSRALFGIFVLALAFFVQQFGAEIAGEAGLGSRTTVASVERPTQLRVLSLNVQAPNDDPSYLLPVIRERQPDVLVLQEVTAPYAEALTQAVGDTYPYTFVAGTDTEHEGAGTWSRLPLSDGESFRLGQWGNEHHRVRILTPQGPVWLYNVHLPNPTDPENTDAQRRLAATIWAFDPRRRDAEVAALAERLVHIEQPFIVAGDLNLTAGSLAYRRLPPTWRDAFAEVGRGFGYTYPAPEHLHDDDPPRWFLRRFSLLRIDYVLVSPSLRPVHAWTEEVIDTDHMAVLADIDRESAPSHQTAPR